MVVDDPHGARGDESRARHLERSTASSIAIGFVKARHLRAEHCFEVAAVEAVDVRVGERSHGEAVHVPCEEGELAEEVL